MKRVSVLPVMIGAAMTIGAAPAAKDPPPIANYWMDVATQSGLGTGPGAGLNAAQIMAIMSGGGGGAARHSLDLRLASRNTAAAPEADNPIPPGLQIGASLPPLT